MNHTSEKIFIGLWLLVLFLIVVMFSLFLSYSQSEEPNTFEVKFPPQYLIRIPDNPKGDCSNENKVIHTVESSNKEDLIEGLSLIWRLPREEIKDIQITLCGRTFFFDDASYFPDTSLCYQENRCWIYYTEK